MNTQTLDSARPIFPIWELVNPRQRTAMVLVVFFGVLATGILGIVTQGWKIWQVTALVLAVMFVALLGKWRDDLRRYGPGAMLLSILLMAQGFHMVEHIAQWFQYYVLNYTMQNSVGLLSPANSEWVHFIWNWSVLLIIGALIALGMRNSWAWALLVYAAAHTTDHTYLLFRFLEMSEKLKALCGKPVSAQGLAGIVGQGGWLAQSDLTRGSVLSRLPGLTTATRLDVHFWWNMGETALLLLAAHTFLRYVFSRSQTTFQTKSSSG